MHTMWKGSISFGLVNIPVRMFSATEDKDVRFKNLHKECHTPIKYKKMCPTCNKEVGYDEIVKGYEYEPGKYVIIEDKDIESIEPDKNKAVEILDFVNLNEIDPIYFDKSYYLSPQETGEKAYNILRKAMRDTKKIAIAKITIRSKQTLAAVRVYNGLIVLETIHYPDEVRSVEQVPNIPEKIDTNKNELKMATELINNLTASFKPDKYKDDYREALKELINKKIEGKEIKVAPKGKEKNVIDLMEALKASIDETKPKKKKKTNKKKTKKDTAS
ncbi:MAG: Ku protein [Firmicutes bacterium]|nr:Ku protein [Bacillota bacterium]